MLFARDLPCSRRQGSLVARVICLLVGTIVLSAQSDGPIINPLGVVNGASFARARLGPGIAPGSVFVIYGAGLGPEEIEQVAPPFPTQLPERPGGTRVEFHSIESGEVFEAFLIYSWQSQVAGIAPSTMPPGQYTAIVTYQDQSSPREPFQVAPAAPGIFTVSMRGYGPGVVQNHESPESVPLNRLTQPALPGGYLIVWGTGLGPIDGPDNTNPPVKNVNENVVVEVGGLQIRPSYSGRSPQFPGVDQINVPLPIGETFPRGCYIPVRVIATETPSNTVTVSLSDTPGGCEHPMGFSPETLASLDAGGQVALANLTFGRSTSNVSNSLFRTATTDIGIAFGRFFWANAEGVALTSGPQGPPPAHGCDSLLSGVVVGFIETDRSVVPPAPSPPPFGPLDAGPVLFVIGPSGQLVELQPRENLFALIASYDPLGEIAGELIEPGGWRFEGMGGTDIGAFQTEIAVPPLPVLDFPNPVRLDEPLEITWPAAGLDSSQTLSVTLSVSVTLQEDPFSSTTRSVGVGCRAPADAGRLEIPLEAMQQLPTPDNPSGSLSFGVSSPEVRFTAPGLDYGATRLSLVAIQTVSVK